MASKKNLIFLMLLVCTSDILLLNSNELNLPVNLRKFACPLYIFSHQASLLMFLEENTPYS